MNLAWCAAVALLLAAPPAPAQPTVPPTAVPTGVPTLGSSDLSAEGVESWVRSWVSEQRASLPQLEAEIRQEELRAREVHEDLIRIRGDAAGQKAVLALGELRPTDFARARRNWLEWRSLAQAQLERATALGQAATSRKEEQSERWELLDDESTAALLPATADVFRQAQGVQRRLVVMMDRLGNLASSQADDAKAAVSVCDEIVDLLDKTLIRLRARFFLERVNFLDWSGVTNGLRKDLAAFVEPLNESRALGSGERLMNGLRQNGLALVTGLILVALAIWRVRRYADSLESAADQIGAERPSVFRRFLGALLVALSRSAVLAVISGAGFILQLSLGASSPAWLEALIALLRAFFAWRMTVAFLRVALDSESTRFRLLIADGKVADLARQRLERVADWLFAGLFISTLIRFVGLASPPLMLAFLAFQLLALYAVVRSLTDERIERLGLTGGWASAARQWRALMNAAIVLALGLAGLGFVNLAWYAAWALFNTNVLALVALLIWGLAASAIDEGMPGAEAWTSRLLKRLWGLGLVFLTVALLPLVWGIGGVALAWLRDLLALGLDVGATRVTVGGVLAALSWIFSAWILGRIVNAFLTRRIFPYSLIDAGVRAAITTTTEYAIICIGVLFAIHALGFDLTSLAIVAGALSVGVGFGMQTLVSNFVSGLIILFERPFRPGDILEHEGMLGSVRRIRTRSTIVQTFDEAELVLPNAELLSKRITNWTLSNNRTRAHIKISVAYNSDLEMVREALIDVASQHPRLIEEPQVFFVAFGDSALEFRLMIWVDVREKMRVVSDILYAIDKAFREKNIEIPFPQRVIRHVHVTGAATPSDAE